MIRHLDRAVTLSLALVVFLAPLPFGGAVGWAETALEVALAVLLAAVAAGGWPAAAWGRAVRTAAAACAALAGWAALQSVAWPAGLAAALSPNHLTLWRQGRALAAAPAAGIPLSLAPEASRGAALGALAVGAALLLGAAAGATRAARRWLGAAVLGGGICELLYGAPRWMTGDTTIWTVDVGSAARRLRGTFVNPNHFALALELALVVSFALWWWGIRRARREISPERRLALAALPALLWATLFFAIVFSGSRAGLAGAVVATALQGLALAASRRRWRLAPIGLGLAVAGVLLAVAFGARQEQARALSASAQDVSLHARLDAWQATLDLWRLFPATGAGLGAFADAFPLVQPATLGGYWTHAHNDALELLAVAGPVGLAAAAVAVFAVARGLGRRLRAEGQRSESRAAVLAGLGALAAAGVHEMFDFGLTLPANALTLAVICGAALAAVPSGARPAGDENATQAAVSGGPTGRVS